MAIDLICGFENGGAAVGDGVNADSAYAVQSSIVRSGTYALRLNPSSAIRWIRWRRDNDVPTVPTVFQSCRFWLRVASLPAANLILASFTAAFASTPQCRLYLDTTGALTLATGTTRETTSSSLLSADSTWHAIEFDCGWSSGAGKRVFVDGVQWASNTTTTITQQAEFQLGESATSHTYDLYIDDLEIHNAPLDSSIIGKDWKILYLPPVSDNARGAWTGGGGGTTNLFDGVNNQPPIGTSAPGTNASQVLCASATVPNNLDLNLRDYTTAGLTGIDTIRAVMGTCIHGEGAGAGTKTGSINLQSNPSSGAQTFQYGQDLGVLGAYPANWRGIHSAAAVAPSVTLGASPVLRIAKTDTGTREAHVCWAGAYVSYTPGTPGTAPPPFQRLWRYQTRRRYR